MDLGQRVVLTIVNHLDLRLELHARDLGLGQILAEHREPVENDRLLAVE
jgi:hypothetical protein